MTMFNSNISHQELTRIMKDFVGFWFDGAYDDIEQGVSDFLARENDRKSFNYLFQNYGFNELESWLMEAESARDKRLPR